MRITESGIRRIIREEAQRVLNEGTDEVKVRDSLSVIQGALSLYGREERIPKIDNELADAIAVATTITADDPTAEARADAARDLIYERFSEIRGIVETLVTKLKSAQAVLLAEEPGSSMR